MNNDPAHTAPSADAEPTPRPTYAPVAMAMGIAMTTWGLMTFSLTTNSLTFMSFMGAALVIWALSSWMREVALEWRDADRRNAE